MFNNKIKSTFEGNLGATNRLVEGTKIVGDLSSHADLRIDGEIIGNVISKGRVVLGSKGRIEGTLTCQNADIEGFVKGKVTVTELLSLKAKANVYGDVAIGKLSVEPGASFTATCIMNTAVKNLNPDLSKEKSA
jgi:cytoskeletal protein CcmA (bactofilin family)